MLLESFRFVSVDPVILEPADYVIGGESRGFLNPELGKDSDGSAASILTASEISFGQNRFIEAAGLVLPTDHFPASGFAFFGPNFTFSPVSDPEPDPLSIALDIRDSINLKSKGMLSMTVASTDVFDAADVDIDSLWLFGDPLLIAAEGTPISPIRTALKDVTDDGGL